MVSITGQMSRSRGGKWRAVLCIEKMTKNDNADLQRSFQNTEHGQYSKTKNGMGYKMSQK